VPKETEDISADSKSDSEPTEENEEFVVTPWNVSGDVDYDKLVEMFGTSKITPELIARFRKLTG